MKLNTAQSDHLGQQQLWSVLTGEADQALDERARGHIGNCPECRQRLESLAAKPDLWKHVSTLLDHDGLGDTIALVSDGPRRTGHERAGHLVDTSQSWLDDHHVDGFSIQSLLDAPSHPEWLGRLGDYDIEREIGRGGMGVVLKAFDTELNRPVAIKIMSPALAGRGAARQRFAREARAAAAILHPNVIAIHGVSVDHRTPYLVMPYITGPSLEQMVEQNGPLTEKDIVRFAMQIAAGLAAAHSQGVIHRDIKPANILIENGVGRVVITDFGLARAESDVSMTQTGWFAGTPAFMSPEQASGQDVDPRSDLFSLGSVMYYMATGRLPFRAEQPMAILERIRSEYPAPARQINSDISPTLSNLIDNLLAKRPGDRLQTAAELQQILEQYLAHLHQPAAIKRPRVGPAARGQHSHLAQRLSWSLAGALLLATGIWIWSWLVAPNSNQPALLVGQTGSVLRNSESDVLIATLGLDELEQQFLDEYERIADRYKLQPEESLHQAIYTAFQATGDALRYFEATPRDPARGFPELDSQIMEIRAAVDYLERLDSQFDTLPNAD